MNRKTSPAESQAIERLRETSPMMAAMSGRTETYVMVTESDALWSELESYL